MTLRGCFVIVSSLSAVVCTTLAKQRLQTQVWLPPQLPRLIKFSSVAQDETHKLLTGVVGVTFSLYKDQQGGSPLWVETQNAQTDAAGLGHCGRCAVEPVQFGYGALDQHADFRSAGVRTCAAYEPALCIESGGCGNVRWLARVSIPACE